MSSDIVERLRAYAKDQGGWHNIDETCEEAADRIETLQAELAKAREALEGIVNDARRVDLHNNGAMTDLVIPYWIDRARSVLQHKEREA